jgi:putative DNA primase/helicase
MSLEKARVALQFIQPVDRDVWVKIGMSLKSEFDEDGFDAWDQWSQGADSYNQKSAKVVWKSIRASGKVGIGTLFHAAKLAGWVDNEPEREPTPQELEARRVLRAQRDAKAKIEEQRKIEGYRRAAAKAAGIIRQCKTSTHNYLRSKQLPDALGLVTEDEELFVPMRSLEGNDLVGGQIIRWLMDERVWEKKMIHGMRAKGAVLRLGSRRSGETWLCEGYATGLSIEAALRRVCANASVLICFSAWNMSHVAPMVPGKKFIFADNDASGTGLKTATESGLPFCMSSVVGEDANDWHARSGVLAVAKAIMELRSG